MPENETPGGGRYGPTRRMLTGRRVLEDVRRIYRCLNLRVVSARPCPQLQVSLYKAPQRLSNARLSGLGRRPPLSPIGTPPAGRFLSGRLPRQPPNSAFPDHMSIVRQPRANPATGGQARNWATWHHHHPTPVADPEALCQLPWYLPKGRRCRHRLWRRNNPGGPARRGSGTG